MSTGVSDGARFRFSPTYLSEFALAEFEFENEKTSDDLLAEVGSG